MLTVTIDVIGTRKFRRDCVRIRWRLRRLINDRRARYLRNSRVEKTACPRPGACSTQAAARFEREDAS